ncbi:MAG: beta-lactamase family protein [Actinomycetota bacterium]|nr:beta-lactamase family protein [Actinomycetota bacterium]
MSDGSRALPGRPSLRYLRLEAKRRLAAGEFPALHQAQAGIAREHGLSSWAVLKQACAQPEQESHALAQLRWLISRFSAADRAGWTAPAQNELREHFDDRFLAVVPAGLLVAQLSQAAADLRTELIVIGQGPLEAHVQLAGVRYLAAVADQPPHRLTALRGLPLAERITDPRVTAPPPARSLGAVPVSAAGIAEEAFAELGLAALILAGGEPDRPAWVVAKGHADLDRAEVLDAGHRFAAPGVTALVTSTAVLRLVAEGRVGLDTAANDQLRTVRLADDAVTVRELLSHTGGVSDPAEFYADSVPDLAALMGPVVPCGGQRGVPQPSNGGYAVLGQLIADVTGMPYARAVTRLVLDPLGMRDSRFPAGPAQIGAGAVTSYTVTTDGVFVPSPARVPAVQAVAGLWSTGADLVRLGTAWSSLLPAALAADALAVQTEPGPAGLRVGLGWLISPGGDTAVHSGSGLDAVAFLRVRVRDLRTHVVLTNRQIPLGSIDHRLQETWNPASSP